MIIKNKKMEEEKCVDGGIWHAVCDTRLKEMGGKSLCCYCYPHEDCDFNKEAEGAVL